MNQPVTAGLGVPESHPVQETNLCPCVLGVHLPKEGRWYRYRFWSVSPCTCPMAATGVAETQPSSPCVPGTDDIKGKDTYTRNLDAEVEEGSGSPPWVSRCSSLVFARYNRPFKYQISALTRAHLPQFPLPHHSDRGCLGQLKNCRGQMGPGPRLFCCFP